MVNSNQLHAQLFEDMDEFACAGGVDMWRRIMGEAMVGVGHYHYDTGFLHWHTGKTFLAGTEYNFSGKKPLWGPKVTLNASGGFCMGISTIYFTDGDVGSLYLAPHFGISSIYTDFRIGYNIPLMKQHLRERVNHFTVSLIFTFVQ